MVHCQKCTARNALNQEFCGKCGARLLLASASSTAVPFSPFSSMGPAVGIEEHVLERISAMEHSIQGLNKRMDALMETIERVAASNFIDHTMIETLTDSLEAAGIHLANLEADWRKRIDSRILEAEEVDRLGGRLRSVMESYRGADRKQFELWIEKSYDLIIEGRGAESVHFLRSAFDHDRTNVELGLLLAEAALDAADQPAALVALNQILEISPDQFEATFLIGMIQQQSGNMGEAEARLERAVVLRKDSAAAHAMLGSVLANTGNNQGALAHLSAALRLKPSAPVHFLLGSVYYGTGENKRAIQHLRQATRLDPRFSEAFYQLGLLCLEMNWLRKAQECFKTAQSLNPRESRYRKRARSFSKDAAGPDALHGALSGLIRDELRLMQYAEWKRTK